MNNIKDTIKVSVYFYSTLRNLAGVNSEYLEIKSKTLLNLLIQIQDQFFDKNEIELFRYNDLNQASINPELIILINDTDYRIIGKVEDIFLKNEDKIVLISSVHGG